jgi:hypothetical protein
MAENHDLGNDQGDSDSRLLLSEEDDDVNKVHITDNFNNYFDNDSDRTPRTGKKISMKSGPPSTHNPDNQTPPRTVTSSPSKPHASHSLTTTSQTRKFESAIPQGLHAIKLTIYIYTDAQQSLLKINEIEHPIFSGYFQYKESLERLIDKAQQNIFGQEPYYTLLNSGYNIDLKQPQLSYKIYSSSDTEFLDFVIDLNRMPNKRPNLSIPHPYFEKGMTKHYSRADISFKLQIPIHDEPHRPQTASIGTSTCDSTILSPIIDQIRTSIPEWNDMLHHQHHPPSTSAPTLPSIPMLISLAQATAPPRHHIQTNPDSRDRTSRPRLDTRLGPPVSHRFQDRSRSNDRTFRR